MRIEEQRKKAEEQSERIEALSSSLEGKKEELAKLTETKESLEEEMESQRVAFLEELEQEKKLRDDLRKDLMQKIAGLQKDLDKERGEKASLKEEFAELKSAKILLDGRYKEVEQKWLALKEIVGEVAPSVLGEVTPEVTIEGSISYIHGPFLSIELEKEAAGEVKPTISVYRRKKLIREVKTEQIHHITIVARVSDETSLEGIEEGDQVRLGLLPGTIHFLGPQRMTGEIFGVSEPGFLTVNLGEEAASTISPIVLIYRGGRLVREVKLDRIDSVIIVVEAADKIAIRGIRENDRVEIN